MNYEDMHWKQIKKMVEERGGVYTNKEGALVFLNGAIVDPSGADNIKAAPDDNVVFDKKKPYGEISGVVANAPGARYIQGGHYFNNQGKKVG